MSTPADRCDRSAGPASSASSPPNPSTEPPSTRSPTSPAGRAAARTTSRGDSSSSPTKRCCGGSGDRRAADAVAGDRHGGDRDRASGRREPRDRQCIRRGPGGGTDPHRRGDARTRRGDRLGPVGRPRGAVGEILDLPPDHFIRTIVALGHPTDAARRPKSATGSARLRARRPCSRSAGRSRPLAPRGTQPCLQTVWGWRSVECLCDPRRFARIEGTQ